ncbi:MAG: hypothetical protein RQ743_14365 [Bacteroidales bacterium]|nr:hypothetical protein [Bacteroidales bacterium]
MTEYKAKITDGFRQEPFESEVTNYEIRETKTGSKQLVLEYTDGPALNIFAPNEINGGEIPGYMAMGMFLRSLQDSGVETYIDIDDGTLTLESIRFEPDICGKTLSHDVTIRTYIKGNGEEGKNYDWKVTGITSNGTPAPKQTEPPRPVTPDEPVDTSKEVELWNDIIMDVLSAGNVSEGGLMKAMKIKVPDAKDQKKMNDVRRTTIEDMATSGIIKKVGNEFTLV